MWLPTCSCIGWQTCWKLCMCGGLHACVVARQQPTSVSSSPLATSLVMVQTLCRTVTCAVCRAHKHAVGSCTRVRYALASSGWWQAKCCLQCLPLFAVAGCGGFAGSAPGYAPPQSRRLGALGTDRATLCSPCYPSKWTTCYSWLCVT